MKNAGRVINMMFIVSGIIFIAYYFCVRMTGYKPSILIIWLLLGTIFIIKGLLYINVLNHKKRLSRIFEVAFNLSALLFLISFSIFCAGIFGSINKTPRNNLDYIIILGAAVDGDKPSPTLKARIDAAYEYLLTNDNTVAIASGGQGKYEKINEGKCITDELIRMGIPEFRIIIESKSTTTVENLRFSLALIDAKDKDIGIVTSSFHVFRSKIMLEHYIKDKVDGISAPFTNITLPNYILREYITFIVDLSLGNIY